MKKIIVILGVLFLSFILVLNILFSANLDIRNEHITIQFNSIFYVLGLVFIGLLLFFGTKYLNQFLYKKDNKVKKVLWLTAFLVYILFMLIWAIVVRTAIVGDQADTCNLAQFFYGNPSQNLFSGFNYAGLYLGEYAQSYPQQITLAFVFSFIFRMFHFDAWGILRFFNIICVILIAISIYKINEQLSKKYQTNKVLLFTLTFSFISIPMLITFVYGDIPSLAFSLLCVYFMMRYIETKQINFFVFASLFMMIAYMLRMNSLIFIIATVIYLFLDFINKEMLKRTLKESLLKITMIISFVTIAIVPSLFVKNYYFAKYDLDKSKSYPTISFLLMAMEEGPRANGWYNEARGEYALKNPEKAKEEYLVELKNRVIYLIENPIYTFHFYTDKVTSMWTENTYSAIANNIIGGYEVLENITQPLAFYQKTLLIIMVICSLLVLIQNKKSLSLEVLFLITIFIGGFSFHILWEAKSRYILPYIVVLIPVASIYFEFSILSTLLHKLKNKFSYYN